MTRNLDIAEDAGDFFENQYSSGTFSGAHSGTSTGTHSGPISTSATFPAGMIINITSTSLTRASNQFTSTSFTDISDDQGTALSVSVTPKTNSKIFLMASLGISGTDYNIYLRFMRDSNAIGINTNPGGSRPAATMSTYGSGPSRQYEIMPTPMQFLDTTPGGNGSTSIVYKIQWSVQSSGSAYINRSQRNTDGTDGTCISTITAMEIAG